MQYCRIAKLTASETKMAKRINATDLQIFAFNIHFADWFKECRRSCEVDRLRWFLRDAEVFANEHLEARP